MGARQDRHSPGPHPSPLAALGPLAPQCVQARMGSVAPSMSPFSIRNIGRLACTGWPRSRVCGTPRERPVQWQSWSSSSHSRYSPCQLKRPSLSPEAATSMPKPSVAPRLAPQHCFRSRTRKNLRIERRQRHRHGDPAWGSCRRGITIRPMASVPAARRFYMGRCQFVSDASEASRSAIGCTGDAARPSPPHRPSPA